MSSEKPTWRQLDRLQASFSSDNESLTKVLGNLRHQGIIRFSSDLFGGFYWAEWSTGSIHEWPFEAMLPLNDFGSANFSTVKTIVSKAASLIFSIDKFNGDLASHGVYSYSIDIVEGSLTLFGSDSVVIGSINVDSAYESDTLEARASLWQESFISLNARLQPMFKSAALARRFGVKTYRVYVSDRSSVVEWFDGGSEELNFPGSKAASPLEVKGQLDSKAVVNAVGTLKNGLSQEAQIAPFASAGVDSIVWDFVDGRVSLYDRNRSAYVEFEDLLLGTGTIKKETDDVVGWEPENSLATNSRGEIRITFSLIIQVLLFVFLPPIGWLYGYIKMMRFQQANAMATRGIYELLRRNERLRQENK